MQDTLTFPNLAGSPRPRFAFPELTTSHDDDDDDGHGVSSRSSPAEPSSITTPSTPFVSAPSSPRAMQGFYFSAPTSPTWATLMHAMEGSPQERGPWDVEAEDGSCAAYEDPMTLWAHKAGQAGEQGSPRNWGKTPLHAEDHGRAELTLTEHSRTEHFPRTEYYGAEYYKAELTKTGDAGTDHTIARTEHLLKFHAQTEHTLTVDARAPRTTTGDVKPEHTIAEPEHTPELPPITEYSSAEDARTEHTRPGDAIREHLRTEDAKAEHSPSEHTRIEYCRTRRPITSHSKTLLPPIITVTHPRNQLHMDKADEADALYSRKSFYASAVPFAWEEKPGTPKAAAVTPETNSGEEDSSSILCSGSSEFEFSSARFSELLDDPPMSPTPLPASFSASAWSLSTEVAQKSSNLEGARNHQTRPLRPPPRLDKAVSSVRQLMKDDAHEESKRHQRSISSLSVPQSPKSPHKFDLRGVLCGAFGPTNADFDPFVVALEKMAASSENNVDMVKDVNKKNAIKMSHKHHRRTQSSSPFRVSHWDDLPTKPNPTSNGSSACKDEVKDMHPIQVEINARNDSFGSMPKGSKRWSFKGFLHRKSPSQQGLLQHTSLRSSEGSSARRESSSSCSSMAEVANMDFDAEESTKMRPSVSSPGSSMVSNMLSTPSSPLSSASSGYSRTGKTSASVQKATKSPYAVHYPTQKAYTEDLRKKTFMIPHKQGLLGCLGLSSKSYRALRTLNPKPLQSVST